MLQQGINDARLAAARRVVFTVLLCLAVAAAERYLAAQASFVGDWTNDIFEDNTEDAMIGNYVGLPLTRSAMLRTQSWQEAMLTLPEWQCRPHGAVYFMRAPQGRRLQISRQFDPATGRLSAYTLANGMAIYLDGRPHPSAYAPHTYFGFSTGVYEGDMLKFTTTHLKEDYPRRIGVPSSDETVLTQYWIRHGDELTWVTIHEDPIYLTEPMVRTVDYRISRAQPIGGGGGEGCVVVEEVGRPAGVVPHYLPGTNPYLGEYGTAYELPLEATLGGAASMYPELARKIIRQRNGIPQP
jgi:hypothetical protein